MTREHGDGFSDLLNAFTSLDILARWVCRRLSSEARRPSSPYIQVCQYIQRVRRYIESRDRNVSRDSSRQEIQRVNRFTVRSPDWLVLLTRWISILGILLKQRSMPALPSLGAGRGAPLYPPLRRTLELGAVSARGSTGPP